MPSFRGCVIILIASALLTAPLALAAAKPKLAKALALLGSTEPICWVDAVDQAEEVEAECPDGTEKDDNNPYCYKPCSVFDNTPLLGVRYVTSTQNDDHCIPACPPNMAKLKATTSAVTCFTCPAGFAPVPGKGCYTKCGVPNTATAGYPESINYSTIPMCAQSCGLLYPKTFNIASRTEPNKCLDSKGNSRTRLTKARSLGPFGKTARLQVQPKSEVDMECPEGSDAYSLYGDDTPAGEPHNGCYQCPPGQITGIYKTEWVYCMPDGCPDDTYTRCGHFCYSNLLDSVFGGLSEEDCVAFLNMFDCLPKCFEDPPESTKAAKVTSSGRPRPKLTSKDGPTGAH